MVREGEGGGEGGVSEFGGAVWYGYGWDGVGRGVAGKMREFGWQKTWSSMAVLVMARSMLLQSQIRKNLPNIMYLCNGKNSRLS